MASQYPVKRKIGPKSLATTFRLKTAIAEVEPWLLSKFGERMIGDKWIVIDEEVCKCKKLREKFDKKKMTE